MSGVIAPVGPGTPAWSAAILAGGASRRMGQDKALLVVDGQAMVRRVVDAAVTAGAVSVVVVGGDQAALSAALAGTDAAVVPDLHPGEGPLGGMLTALHHAAEGIVLVASCDLVSPAAGAMRATVAALRAHDADVAAPEVDGAVQWLHSAWRTGTVAAPLAARFAAGERSVHRAVRQAGLRLVDVPGLAPAALADADTPADLERHPAQQDRHPGWP